MLEQFKIAADRIMEIGRKHPQYSFSSFYYSIVNHSSTRSCCSFEAAIFLDNMLPTIAAKGQTLEELYHQLEVEVQVSQVLTAA